LATLFTSIQTKLRFQKLPAYVPPAGLLPSDTEEHLIQLGHTETNRRRQLNNNMNTIKTRLEKGFADTANIFYDNIQKLKHAALEDIGSDLQQAKAKFDNLLSQVKSLPGSLGPVEKAEKLCEEANIESNEYTDHTTDDLSFEINQLEKLIQKSLAAVESQIAASTGSTISAEQLKEYKDTFNHFDVDGDQTLNRLEFKSCLSALGLVSIDFDGGDTKFEHIFQDVSGGSGNIGFDNFVEYMTRLAGSSMDQNQLTSSFQTLASGKNHLTVQDCQVGGLQPEIIEFITTTLPPLDGVPGGYDYNGYLKNSFK